MFGAAAVYMGAAGQIEMSAEGRAWGRAPLAVVPAYLPHQIVADNSDVFIILLEADAFDLSRLPDPMQRKGSVNAIWFIERIRRFEHELSCRIRAGSHLTSTDFDNILFDEALPERALDRRIAPVVRKFELDPNKRMSGAEGAAAANLSYSHYLRLFRSEVGVSFAKFRAWKRARAALYRLQGKTNIAALAQDLAFVDASQFYHSMRDVYGLTPSKMFNANELPIYRPPHEM